MTKLTLQEFYHKFYQSNPYALIDDAYHEIADICDKACIDYSKICNDIQLEHTGKMARFKLYAKRVPDATDFKGRNDLFSELKYYNEFGLWLPKINVVLKQNPEGTWLGISYLSKKLREYNRDTLTRAEIERQQAEIAARNKRAAQRKQEAALKQLEYKQSHQEAVLNLLNYTRQFNAAPQEQGTDAYLVAKGVEQIAQLTCIKQVPQGALTLDANGKPALNDTSKPAWHFKNTPFPAHLSIPFYRLDRVKGSALDGQPVAFQRIFQDKHGKFHKYTTRTVPNELMSVTGAAHIIGKLENGAPIVLGEGFATVASALMATKGMTGVVAYSSSNIKVVADILRAQYPDSKILLLADNDKETCDKGQGNAGLLAAIEIVNKHPKKVTCQVPIFGKGTEGSDFNDIHKLYGLDEVRSQLHGTKNRLSPSDKTFDLELLKLRYVKTDKLENQVYYTVRAGIQLTPAILSRQEVFEQVRDNILRLCSDRKIKNDKLLSKAFNDSNRLYQKKIKAAQSQRSFSERITNAGERPSHINYVKMPHWQVNEETVNLIRDLDGPVILRAGMGSRKSSVALKTLVREHESAICAAHRISLMEDLTSVLAGQKNDPDFQSDILYYKDAGSTELASNMPKLVVCINSIINGKFRRLVNDHEFFALDEATQVLSSTLTGNAMAHPVKVFDTLIHGIACTREKVLLADADANDNLVWLLEKANDRREQLGLERWQKINVIELPVNVAVESEINGQTVHQKIEVEHTSPDRAIFEMKTSIAKGERLLFATDSTKAALQIVEAVKEENARRKAHNKAEKDKSKHLRPLRHIYVSQDTKPDPDVVAFQKLPSLYCQKYDVFIYSPAISSGVSITAKHFEKHYAIFYGEVLPSNAIQMLRRDRTAAKFMVGFGAINKRREESVKAYVTGLISAQPDAMDCHISDQGFTFASHDTLFNTQRIRMITQENAARNDFTNNMLLILEDDGYLVSRLDSDKDKEKAAKEWRLETNEKIIAERNELHKSVDSISEELRQEYLDSETLTEGQRAQLNRFTIEEELHLEVNDDTIDFQQNGGVGKAKRFELLHMSTEQAQAYDEAESQMQFEFKLKTQGSPFPNYVRLVGKSWEHVLDRRQAALDVQAANIMQAQERKQQEIAEAIKNGTIKRSRVPVYTSNDTFQVMAEIEGEIVQSPLVQVSQRAYVEWQAFFMQRYFNDLGLCPKTGAGIIKQATLKKAAERLITDRNGKVNLELYNTVSACCGRIQALTSRSPQELFKGFCIKLGLTAVKTRAKRRTSNGEMLWSICPKSWAFMTGIASRRAEAGQTYFDASELLNDDLEMIHDLTINSIDLKGDRGSSSEGEQTAPQSAVEQADQTTSKPSCIKQVGQAASEMGIPSDWLSASFTTDELQDHFDAGHSMDQLLATIATIYKQEGGVIEQAEQQC